MKNMRTLMMAGVLTAAVAASAFGEGTRIVTDGSTTVGPIAKAFAEYYVGKHNDVNMHGRRIDGTATAPRASSKGPAISGMSRVKEEEQLAAKEGLNIVEHIVAMDGIAVVVHPGNDRGSPRSSWSRFTAAKSAAGKRLAARISRSWSSAATRTAARTRASSSS